MNFTNTKSLRKDIYWYFHSQVWNQVHDQVWNQVWNQVNDQVWNEVVWNLRDQSNRKLYV